MENKQDKGFTLVELLIVIVILGILATVTVFAVRGITQNAQENSCEVEGRTIATAIEAYYADNNVAPSDSDDGGWAELEGTYLKETTPPLSDRWDFTGGATDAEATVTGKGTCAVPAG
jgi:general secretion pathway protein G